MPVYRGINMKIISQAESKVCPEFPHPESSQFTYRSPNLGDISEDWTPPYVSHESKADRLLGTRFWLQYNIEEIAVRQSKFYYFKLNIDGKTVMSWGIKATETPEGRIMRALYEPDSKLNLPHEGFSSENTQIESRLFLFADKKSSSLSEEGGLIEVSVFRVYGRRRRLPLLSKFKNQNNGIKFPSQGIVAEPQTCKYYDWHLKDPMDNPFAIFRFHYRSWGLLERLKVIPSDHPRNSLTTLLNRSSLSSQHKYEQESKKFQARDSVLLNPLRIPVSLEESLPVNTKLSHRDQPKYPVSSGIDEVLSPRKTSSDSKWPSVLFINKLIVRPPNISLEIPESEKILDSVTEQKSVSHWCKQRPLPRIPSNQSSPRDQIRRKLSISSTVSITPSLISHPEDNPITAEIGTASVLLISNSPSLSDPQKHGT